MVPSFDARVFPLLYAQEPGPLRSIAIGLSLIGGGWGIFFFVPFLGPRRTRRFAGWLVGTLAVAGVVVFGLKALIGRSRPYLVFTGMKALALDSPTDHSFPSGHAAGSFAFALFLSVVLSERLRHVAGPPRTERVRGTEPRARRTRGPSWIGALAIIFASGVGVSRVVLGFHFPLDVLAGELIGGTLGAVGARLYLRSDRRLAARREAATSREGSK